MQRINNAQTRYPHLTSTKEGKTTMTKDDNYVYQPFTRNYEKQRRCDIYRWRPTLPPGKFKRPNRHAARDESTGVKLVSREKRTKIPNRRTHRQRRARTSRAISILRRTWKLACYGSLNNQAGPPTTNRAYWEIPYMPFKELTKLPYRYQTYYPERYIANENSEIAKCPICQKECRGEIQLAKHRKKYEQCAPVYWGDKLI